jgi:hypothetical protein
MYLVRFTHFGLVHKLLINSKKEAIFLKLRYKIKISKSACATRIQNFILPILQPRKAGELELPDKLHVE